MKEFKVPRNDRLLSEIYAKFDLRARVHRAATGHRRTAVAIDSKEMKECPARYECWLKGKVKR